QEIDRRTDVAGPEGVSCLAVLLAGPLDLLDRVHRELSGACQPPFVAGALEELEERVTVAGGSVAEAGALEQRPGPPRELATGNENLGEGVVAERQCRE